MSAESVFDVLADIQAHNFPLTARLDDIEPDPTQDRKHFSNEELENLAESIRAVGVILPVVVSPQESGKTWMLVDGERRWRAAALAGLVEVPIKVREDMSARTKDRHVAQLIANTNRADLLDYELAKGVRRQLEEWGDKRGDRQRLSKLINKPPAFVSRLLAMLEPEFEHLVQEGVILHAEVLARFRTLAPDLQNQLLAQARETGQPIQTTHVREVVATAKAEAEAAAGDGAGDGAPALVVAPAGGAVESEPTMNVGAGDGAADLTNDGSATVAVEAGGGDAPATLEVTNPDLRMPAARDSEPGDGGDDAGNSGSNKSTAAAKDKDTREKAVGVRLTGERVEALLRYLVDKSTDRLEVKLSADLARAVIENLGGEVPERADTYADRIIDLLDTKL